MVRYLLNHPESESLFEVKSWRARQQCVEQGCDDVTGIMKFESKFNRSKGRKVERQIIRTTKKSQPVEPESVLTDLPLHVKYRPKALGDVVGQADAVNSLRAMLKKSTHPHSYLFTGPSGCGKTTLARILAAEFNCSPANILETDAATNSGIDAMLDITSTLRYKGFGEQPNKLIILDECHALSKAAWQSLLKNVEEPPAHVYFAFCTTDAGKIPDTIRTRCSSYDLKPVRYDDLMDLLDYVAENEGMKIPDPFLQQVARACNGSPRQALVMLATIEDCQDEDEVARLLEMPLDNKEIIDLCRLLVSGKLEWSKVQATIKALPEPNPESVRIVVVNYLNACLLGAKDGQVPRLLDILSSFSTPCNPTDKMAPILLAIGNHVFPA